MLQIKAPNFVHLFTSTYEVISGYFSAVALGAEYFSEPHRAERRRQHKFDMHFQHTSIFYMAVSYEPASQWSQCNFHQPNRVATSG